MKKNIAIIIAFFLSGVSALILEVTWIRPIGFVFDSTIYTVSVITASLMAGLALGSFLAGKLADKVKKPLLMYALLECGIGLSALVLLEAFNLLPNFNQYLLAINSPMQYSIALFFSVMFVLLIPTTLMGATFPVVTKFYVSDRIGKGIGELYAANNMGAIAGSLLAGFLIIPVLGIKWTIVLAASLNIGAALMVLVVFHRGSLKFVLPSAVILFALLSFSADYSMTNLYTKGFFGLFGNNYLGNRSIEYYKEGVNGSVAVMKENPGSQIYRLFINGQGSSSLRLSDMRVSGLLGFLPRWVRPEADNAMVIGFGVGGASRVLSYQIDTTTVEIEPDVLETAPFFEPLNKGVLQDPKHKVAFDDARNFLATTDEKFDIVVNHPLDPYKSFSSLLFTEEFFELVKAKLTPDGVYVQWIPIYNLSIDEFKDFYYTLDSVFPHQLAFINTKAGEINIQGNTVLPNGGELIIIASAQPVDIDMASLTQSFNRLTTQEKDMLSMLNLSSPEQVMNLLLFKGEELDGYFDGARMITDDYPKMEFAAAMNKIKNTSSSDQVIAHILNYAKRKQRQ